MGDLKIAFYDGRITQFLKAKYGRVSSSQVVSHFYSFMQISQFGTTFCRLQGTVLVFVPVKNMLCFYNRIVYASQLYSHSSVYVQNCSISCLLGPFYAQAAENEPGCDFGAATIWEMI